MNRGKGRINPFVLAFIFPFIGGVSLAATSFQDDFEDNTKSYSYWTNLQFSTTWTIVGQIGNRVLKQSNDGNGVHAQTYHLQTTSDSFHFQATIRPTSFGAADGRINLWFSHADANNTFFLSISSYSLQFIKKVSSVTTYGVPVSMRFATGTRYLVEISRVGSSIEVYIDGVFKIATTDQDLLSGIKFGLSTWQAAAEFDDVSYIERAIPLGVNQPNLFWYPPRNINLADQYALLGKMKASGIRRVRLNWNGIEDKAAVSDLVGQCNRLGLEVLLFYMFTAENSDELYGSPADMRVIQDTTTFVRHGGWAWPSYRLSAVDVSKFNTRFREFIQWLKDNGRVIQAVEIGNEPGWASFNGDFPIGGSIRVYDQNVNGNDSDLRRIQSGFRKLGECVEKAKRAVEDIYVGENVQILLGGLNNPDSRYVASVQASYSPPEEVYRILKGTSPGLTDYTQFLDGVGVHFYPQISSPFSSDTARQNIKTEISGVMTPLSPLLRSHMPIWITEFGFSQSSLSEANRLASHSWLVRSLSDPDFKAVNWDRSYLFGFDIPNYQVFSPTTGQLLPTGQLFQQFATSGGLDATPPAMAWVSPVGSSTYTSPSTVVVEVTATDNVGVTRVCFARNGVVVSTQTTAGPSYSYSWPVTAVDNGQSTWTVTAYDLMGNRSTTAPLSVTVDIPWGNPPTDKEFIGITHVDGKFMFSSTTSVYGDLDEGAQMIENMGSEQIFVYLTYKYQVKDYPRTDFPSGITNLKELADSAPFRRLFAMNFKTYILNAYSFSNWAWSSTQPFSSARVAAEENEIKDLASYLINTYQNTGKTFIIKNWEGDWMLRPSRDKNEIIDLPRIQAMQAWLTARQTGVNDARSSTVPSNVYVYHAIEFNLPSLARDGTDCMLKSVIPNTPSDMLAYSSWETINVPLPQLANKIRDDIGFIHRTAAGGSVGINRPLFVSEFGFRELNWSGENIADRTTTAINAFKAAGVRQAFYWEIIDNVKSGVDVGLTLINPDGTRTPPWAVLRQRLGAYNGSTFISQTVPQRMVPGMVYVATITFRNDGNVPWNQANQYLLESAVAPHPWGINNISMSPSDSISPGGQKTFTFTVVAPTVPGTYAFRWGMKQNHVENFGIQSPQVDIRVSTVLAPDTIDGARAYPVPYRPGLGAEGITFDQLPEGTAVRLLTAEGRPVKTLTADSSGLAPWDLTNDDGTPVASGVYVAVIEKTGARKKMKVVVQK